MLEGSLCELDVPELYGVGLRTILDSVLSQREQ